MYIHLQLESQRAVPEVCDFLVKVPTQDDGRQNVLGKFVRALAAGINLVDILLKSSSTLVYFSLATDVDLSSLGRPSPTTPLVPDAFTEAERSQ